MIDPTDKIYTLEDANEFITLNTEGPIVIQTVFKKRFDGKLELLLSCVENHILLNDYNEEYIDWSMVYSDYDAIMEKRDA